jgi:hypothetical protein
MEHRIPRTNNQQTVLTSSLEKIVTFARFSQLFAVKHRESHGTQKRSPPTRCSCVLIRFVHVSCRTSYSTQYCSRKETGLKHLSTLCTDSGLEDGNEKALTRRRLEMLPARAGVGWRWTSPTTKYPNNGGKWGKMQGEKNKEIIAETEMLKLPIWKEICLESCAPTITTDVFVSLSLVAKSRCCWKYYHSGYSNLLFQGMRKSITVELLWTVMMYLDVCHSNDRITIMHL